MFDDRLKELANQNPEKFQEIEKASIAAFTAGVMRDFAIQCVERNKSAKEVAALLRGFGSDAFKTTATQAVLALDMTLKNRPELNSLAVVDLLSSLHELLKKEAAETLKKYGMDVSKSPSDEEVN